MKIDPYILMEQLVEQYAKSIMDQIAWMHLSRSLAKYKDNLKYFDPKAIADIESTFSFIEKRIDKFIKQYDSEEKEVRGDFNKLRDWLHENQISDATLKDAMAVALEKNKDTIKKMVSAANEMASILLQDCTAIGYTGENIAFLEVLNKQTYTDVLNMFIKFQ